MEKLDLAKKHRDYYTAKQEPEVLEITAAQFLSITGKGDPSGKGFSDKIQTLYATAYTLKFMYKALGQDFVVAKLEGLWGYDEEKYRDISMREAPEKIPRSEWSYRMLIRLPEFVTEDMMKKAIDSVINKKQILMAKEVEFYNMLEGKVVQMLHIGPFSDEHETLEQIQLFIHANNFKRNGLHHEIYLSDFRKTPAHRLKTILREPVK